MWKYKHRLRRTSSSRSPSGHYNRFSLSRSSSSRGSSSRSSSGRSSSGRSSSSRSSSSNYSRVSASKAAAAKAAIAKARQQINSTPTKKLRSSRTVVAKAIPANDNLKIKNAYKQAIAQGKGEAFKKYVNAQLKAKGYQNYAFTPTQTSSSRSSSGRSSSGRSSSSRSSSSNYSRVSASKAAAAKAAIAKARQQINSTPTKKLRSSRTVVAKAIPANDNLKIKNAYKQAIAQGKGEAFKKYVNAQLKAKGYQNYAFTPTQTTTTKTTTPTQTTTKPKITEAIFKSKWNSKTRQNAAKSYGIKNYVGSAAQNTLLRKKIREGLQKNKVTKDNIAATKNNIVATKDNTVATKNNITTANNIAANNITRANNNKSNLEKLKKLRLSGKTDSDLLLKAEKTVGKDSKQYKLLKDFLDKNPPKDGTENINSTILKDNKETLVEKQVKSLENQRDNKLEKDAENYLKAKEVLSQNNEALQGFYRDMEVQLKDFIETSKKTKEDALRRTKTTELNKVTGRIRALLARRGIDISKISPEQLIAMSGEVGGQALEAINEAITKTEQDITDLVENKTAEINKYVEQGLIKQGEADLNIEKLRQLKEKMASDIKSNYITNVFSVARANMQDKDNNKAEVLNTVSKFVTQLGISGTAQGIMQKYIDNLDSVEALKEMIADLNDKNSKLYKAVADIEKAAALQQALENKAALLKATKTSSSSSSTGGVSKINKLTTAQKNALVKTLAEKGSNINPNLVGQDNLNATLKSLGDDGIDKYKANLKTNIPNTEGVGLSTQ